MITAVAALGGCCAAASEAQGVRGGLAKTKPVRASRPPARVSRVLTRTQAASSVVLYESAQTGTTKYVVDGRQGRAEVWEGRRISLIQIGRTVYAPKPKRSCYASAKRSSALLPNVAGMLLPSGVAALSYKSTSRTIKWSIKTSASYQPHGTVTVSKAGRIVGASIYSGPGVPLTAIVRYPSKAPRIAAPRKLCSK